MEAARLPEIQLRSLSSALTAIISGWMGAKEARGEPRLTSDNVKVALPSRQELQHARELKAPIYATLLLSGVPMATRRIAGERRYKWASLDRLQRERLASIMADIVAAQTGFRLSRTEISLIGENGVFGVPSREELERILSGRSVLYISLFLSINPEPVL